MASVPIKGIRFQTRPDHVMMSPDLYEKLMKVRIDDCMHGGPSGYCKVLDHKRSFPV